MKLWDVLLIAALAAAVGLAVWRMAVDRKKGKCPCGGDCGSCGRCDCRRR